MAESTSGKKNFWLENNYFKNKSKAVKRMIKDCVYENGAICDEIAQNQAKLLIVREECQFLTKKIKFFESQPGISRVVQVNYTAVNKSNTKKKANANGNSEVVQVNNTAVNKSNTKKKDNAIGTSGVVQVYTTAVNKSNTKQKANAYGNSEVVQVNNTAVNKSNTKKKDNAIGTSGVVQVYTTAVNKSNTKQKANAYGNSEVVQVNNTAVNKSNTKKKDNAIGTSGVVQVYTTAVNKSNTKQKANAYGNSEVVQVNNTAVNKSNTKKKDNAIGTSGVVQVYTTAVNKSNTKQKANAYGTSRVAQVNNSVVTKSNTKKAIANGTSGVVQVYTTAVNKSNTKQKSNAYDVTKPMRQTKKKKTEIEQPIITGNVTIYNIGKIIYDTPFYYSDTAIYPVGYYATRTYAHFRNIFIKCTYHCKVFKTDLSPRFEIMDHDKHFKVIGLSTNECHSHLISLINKMLGTDDLISANTNGDRFFGLTLPPVRFKLEEKPESQYCTGYIPLKLQSDHREIELEAENDPSVSFESLHACLKRFRSRNSDSD